MQLELNCEERRWNFDLSGSVVQKRELDFSTCSRASNRVGAVSPAVQWRLGGGEG